MESNVQGPTGGGLPTLGSQSWIPWCVAMAVVPVVPGFLEVKVVAEVVAM